MENKFLAKAQRLGLAIMLPIATLPAAALLLRFGALFELNFITSAGAVFFDNLPLLFGIGIAVGLSIDKSGAAALSGGVAQLVITACVKSMNADLNLGVFSGIIGGILAAWLYNKYYNIKLPSWLGFFSGKRFVPIVTSAVAIILSIIIGLVWPFVESGIDGLGAWITGAGAIGLFVYGTLNRLLIPLGLHHILNSLVWFVFGDFTNAAGEVVTGDLNRFFAGDPSAGGFMTGFFPIMMFGLPFAALAMYKLAKKENKKAMAGILLSVAFTSFLTGITEPIEFLFMFLAPALYVAHALLSGLALALTSVLGIKSGFGFSAGLIDYVVNFNLATKPLLLLLVGLMFGIVYFLLFYFYIRAFNVKTPGREDGEVLTKTLSAVSDDIPKYIVALGGIGNLLNIGSCISRLRLEVKDNSVIDEQVLTQLGAQGIVKPSSNTVQVVLGQKAEAIADGLNKIKLQE